jgi:hypothetical protein
MKQFLTIRNAAVVAVLLAASACSSSSPVNPTQSAADSAAAAAPTSATFTDGKTSITLTTPQLLVPADAAAVKFADQPVTLTVKNAVATRAGAMTYSFQVASDASFATLVYSKDGVTEGTGGQTSLKIDSLAGSKTYFWRAAGTSNGFKGPFAKGRTFVMGPPVVLQNPVNLTPANGSTVNGTPLFTVNNIARTGPAGAISYRFDLSDSAAFTKIVFTSTVAEGSGQTSVAASATLPSGTYFWRVQASDPANGLATAFSAATSFNYQSFNMANATIQASPSDLGSWPETAKITSVTFTGDSMLVDFDRRTGSNRWPDEPFGDGSIEYTLGMCVNIGGHWYCSAVVQFWFGRDLGASGAPGAVSYEWFYDPARWGGMTNYQPQDGETVGFFVGSGNLRGRTDSSAVNCPRLCERSNVAFVPFSQGGFANYDLSSGKISLKVK